MYFITGNKGKFGEVKTILDDIEQMDIELPEIQDMDPKEIVKAKLVEALKHHQGEFMVEDTSLCLECLNGLPGPFIKFFLKSIGFEGLSDIAKKMGNNNAEARVIIGYARNADDIHFFEGVVKGKIVTPNGAGFGWDPIFQPEGSDKTYGQMTREEKANIGVRSIAVKKLKEFRSSPPSR